MKTRAAVLRGCGEPWGIAALDLDEPEAGDCLVPEDLMRGILGQALGVAEDAIDLTYPSEANPKR